MTREDEVAARIGAARAARQIDRLTAAMREVAPDARVIPGRDNVTIEGRGVLARLRWPGGLIR